MLFYSYLHNSIGKRNSFGKNGATTLYVANELNQYTNALAGGRAPTYDPDGNMTSDGEHHFTWVAENRLVGVSPRVLITGSRTYSYEYDHMGRRVKKIEKRHAMAESDWIVHTFDYDAWNLLRERIQAADAMTTNQYTWGIDLSGTLQGAGGIGGLLAVICDDGAYLPTYDANGNITEYVSTNGEVAAHYDYSPFGETLVSSGPLAASFTHRFSTKPWCQATGLCEYQYRKYTPRIGRWMSRDPIWEIGGRNLFSYCENNPINEYDFLGLKKCYRWMLVTFYSGQPPKDGRASYQKSDLTEDDAAVGLTNWTNTNGTVSKVRNANGPSDWAYPVYTKFIVHRLTKSGKKTDGRAVRDSGKGWAYPRKNLPGGVAVDEWLDLWMKNQTKARELGTEIDLVEYEIEDDCDCLKGWSEDKFLTIPENLQKIISGGEEVNTGVKVNYPTWWPNHDGQSVE